MPKNILQLIKENSGFGTPISLPASRFSNPNVTFNVVHVSQCYDSPTSSSSPQLPPTLTDTHTPTHPQIKIRGGFMTTHGLSIVKIKTCKYAAKLFKYTTTNRHCIFPLGTFSQYVQRQTDSIVAEMFGIFRKGGWLLASISLDRHGVAYSGS